MGKNKDIIPDFDDLLFKSRNKEYGAYQLRKRYNRVVSFGILVSMLLGSSAVIIPSLKKHNEEFIVAGRGKYVKVEMEKLPPPEDLLYVPPPPAPPEKTRAEETVKYVAPVIVDSIAPLDLKPASTDDVLAQGPVSGQPVNTSGFGNELLPGEGSSGEGDPFLFVEVMPTFKGGGLEKFREWIFKHTNYPQEAVDAKIRGTVYLTFIVEKDGSVSNVTILKGVHPLLDNEAVKVISESPKWTPGLQRGQPVRVRYQIPLAFTL